MNWLSYQELDIVRDLIARLPSGSLEVRKNQKGKLKMLGLYYINEGYTYTFRANVYGVTDKSITLGDVETLYDGEFVPFKDGDDNKYLYYMRNNDLCKDIDTGMYIEFKTEIDEMKLNDEDIIGYDSWWHSIEDYREYSGEDILSEYSIIENIINEVRKFGDKCMFNGEAIHLHQLLRDVYTNNVIRVLANPSEIKILGTSELEDFETHSITKYLYMVK